MPSNDDTLKAELRAITGYDTLILSDTEIEMVTTRAKKHIRSRKNLSENFDFYADDTREEALFWFSCLFAKVAAGELDSQSINVAAVDADTLLAKDDDEITTWYRNAMLALRQFQSSERDSPAEQGITSPQRANREYGSDSDSGGLDENAL